MQCFDRCLKAWVLLTFSAERILHPTNSFFPFGDNVRVQTLLLSQHCNRAVARYCCQCDLGLKFSRVLFSLHHFVWFLVSGKHLNQLPKCWGPLLSYITGQISQNTK